MHDSDISSKTTGDPEAVPAVTAADDRTTREKFRLTGRRVLQTPADYQLHEQRIQAASVLNGAEPLQAALVDMLSACTPDSVPLPELLLQAEVRDRLAPYVVDALLAQANTGKRLPRANRFATRWCVLATPSLDVPPRARLCGADDSRAIAGAALEPILAGDEAAEQSFLAHCAGSRDTLAFMLAQRAMLREGRNLSSQWREVMDILQQEME